MEKTWCIITILSLCSWTLDAQIKRQYTDKKDASRTVVIKDKTADDFRILEEQFGDATMGQVIRITTTDPEANKIKPPKIEKIKTQSAPPPRKAETAERTVNKPRRAEVDPKDLPYKPRPKPTVKKKVKPKPPPPVKVVKKEKPYVRPEKRAHGPPPPKTYRKKLRWKPAKRKRVNNRKKYNCFHF